MPSSDLGGIGKTQTAVEYTYRYRSEYRYIFWVRADTEVALQAGFVEIAKLLDLPEQNATNPADTVQAVKHWLEHTGEWLLVFDNADAPELLKAYYPRTPRGHILLTSRAQLFDTLGIARPLALEKMDPEEALDFLFKRTARAQSDPAEKNAAEQLAAELGYLPLALEQAAAYITAKTARFQDYLASYQRQRLALLNKAQPKDGRVPCIGSQHLGAQFPGSRKRPGRSRYAAGERLFESRCYPARTAHRRSFATRPSACRSTCHLRGPARAQRSVGTAHALLAHPTRCRYPDLQHPPYGAGSSERPDGSRTTSTVGRTGRASG